MGCPEVLVGDWLSRGKWLDWLIPEKQGDGSRGKGSYIQVIMLSESPPPSEILFIKWQNGTRLLVLLQSCEKCSESKYLDSC